VALHRGEVRDYKPVLERPGQSLQRLIVSANPLNDSDLPIVLGLQVVERDPNNLLAVRLEGHGWAVATTIEQVIRRRLGAVAGVISLDEQRAVDNALRATMEL
jgi:hypothetical protein